MNGFGHNNSPASAADSINAVLRWLSHAGVTEPVQESPRDRFAETASEAAERQTSRPATPSAAPPPAVREAAPQASSLPAYHPVISGDISADEARQMARNAQSLEELAAAYAAFEGCSLKLTAKTLVFGNGATNADLMLIGEAPGREEDIAGEPFVGRSGQLLNRMLHAIGLERNDVRVTNVIAWRPPGNRSPTPAETELCLPFVQRHIELIAPKVVVCLGSPSAKAVLSTTEGIMRLRGHWTELNLPGLAKPVPATALLHPAYLLRQPAQKRLAWRDLLAIKSRLDNLALVANTP
ncbi:uracil-DNA glycosylase [Aureimonas fodinaquatilis]|uniref:Type-4 uracil-DNA glycosylase n=1 Tax=Aureimonas fodinaquatilis TaxID=2565783 RepID=A0A5B0DX16_9HYPH|nr:uracil-DNA glycosylase [Aureimonas fodinaquatilis]KAA0971046.1 uracil-DNA glycosylase [Aureimonas fodinaquatilis]